MRILAVTPLTLVCALMGCAEPSKPTRTLAGTDPARGLQLIHETGCASCHVIPGVRWPQGRTGNALAGIGARPLIAGRLPNQPDVMVAFVRDAPSLLPDTAMPSMPLTDAQARDVAAYLYTLDDN